MTEPKLPLNKMANTAADESDASNEDSSEPQGVNPQKRKADVEPTRYGDWELNGRCVDF